MRILQISNYYPPEIGGIEKIAQAISEACIEKHKVEVVCFTHQKEDNEDIVDGIRVVRIGSQMKIASQQLSTHAFGIIKREIDDFKPNAIVIHLPNPFLEAILLHVISKEIKLIVYWHSDIVKQKLGEKLFHRLTVRLLNRANCVIATSPNYIDGSKYLSKYKSKCKVIPNCIDEKGLQIDTKIEVLIDSIKKEHADKTLCVCVGRQVPYKGFEYAVEAFKHLDENYKLIIIGREGESTPKIKELANGMNNVELLGEVDSDTLKAYLAACDIFCFPSITKNEAFGIALAEGMYFEKPAITFTIPGSGVNYVNINGVTGIEVENCNSERFADAIKQLSNNQVLRNKYGKEAQKRVENLFLANAFKSNFDEVLLQIE